MHTCACSTEVDISLSGELSLGVGSRELESSHVSPPHMGSMSLTSCIGVVGTFVNTDEPTLIHYYYLKSVVYTEAYYAVLLCVLTNAQCHVLTVTASYRIVSRF